jgi:hypothetical protein
MSEAEIARSELARAKAWRVSCLHRCSNLGKQLQAARLKQDCRVDLVAQELRDAERQAQMAAADVAGYRRILDRMTGDRR